jgi:sigma-B regulation protein RsbU (phosphoserine phosphatase)
MDENSRLTQTEGKDPPIGLIPGTHYRQIAFKLEPDDLLLLYTDGLSEAMDEAGQELNHSRLVELAGCLPVDSPFAAGKALLKAVIAFRKGVAANDDQTLIVLQRRTTEEIHRREDELQSDISSSWSGTSRQIFGNFSSAEESNC